MRYNLIVIILGLFLLSSLGNDPYPYKTIEANQTTLSS